MKGRVAVGCLMIAAAVGPGCRMAGLMAQAIPRKTKAIYRLPDRPTLVLVEDPSGQLGGPLLVRRIAMDMSQALSEQAHIKQVISPNTVEALRITLADRWATQSIDQIGAAVGAEQVVYLNVESVRVYSQPGLLEPSATVWLKAIDLVNRQRLFPTVDHVAMGKKGQRLDVKLLPRGAMNPTPTMQRAAFEKLAARIARDCGRIFYDYLPRQPGEPFE